MRREEVAKFIGQRRVWVIKGSPPERHEVVCTHVRGTITLMAGDCTGEDFDKVFCAYQFPRCPQGSVYFEPEKFASLELCSPASKTLVDESCCPKCDSEICICGLGSPASGSGGT